MNKVHISKEEAKMFLVNYQGLGKFQYGKSGMVDYIKKVGCIQFDPLNVVGRNPDLVMQARIKDYHPDRLSELLYEDRVLVDGWDKMMAIYHIKDWPYMKRIRDEHVKSNLNIMKHRGTQEALTYLEKVKEILRKDGPKFSREINLCGVEKGRWSSNKYSNIALDHLFHMGEIGIIRKNKSQKCFDLIENLFDKTLLESKDPFASDDAFIKWYIKRRISSIGMLWGRNGGGWLGHFISDKMKRDIWLQALVDEEELSLVFIEDIEEPFYVLKENLKDLMSVQKNESKEVKILAPLDNLLWDRALVEAIFDFKYSWEVYIPKNKRKFGYYVLPVMYGENIIARFEPVKPTKGAPFQMRKWWWEEGVDINAPLIGAIEMGLSQFSSYLGIEKDSNAYRHMLLKS